MMCCPSFGLFGCKDLINPNCVESHEIEKAVAHTRLLALYIQKLEMEKKEDIKKQKEKEEEDSFQFTLVGGSTLEKVSDRVYRWDNKTQSWHILPSIPGFPIFKIVKFNHGCISIQEKMPMMDIKTGQWSANSISSKGLDFTNRNFSNYIGLHFYPHASMGILFVFKYIVSFYLFFFFIKIYIVYVYV